jgi:hypothetical protein
MVRGTGEKNIERFDLRLKEKKSGRKYSSVNRLQSFRRHAFEVLIRPRLLDGLTWEQVPKKIAATLKVSVSRGRGIRHLLLKWNWVTVTFTPSIVKTSQTAFDEFNGE